MSATLRGRKFLSKMRPVLNVTAFRGFCNSLLLDNDVNVDADVGCSLICSIFLNA